MTLKSDISDFFVAIFDFFVRYFWHENGGVVCKTMPVVHKSTLYDWIAETIQKLRQKKHGKKSRANQNIMEKNKIMVMS